MEDKKVVKIGIVGLGRGLSLAQGLIGNKNARIAAICDKFADRVENGKEFCEKHGITDYEVYDDYEELLKKSDVDAIILATDAPLHTPMAIQAMEAGKHVLSEIPVVYSMEHIRDLKRCVKAHPELKYFCGENCCYWAIAEAWKEMRENGMFGEIAYAESEYHHCEGKITPPDEGGFKTGWRIRHDAITYLTHNLGPLLYIMDDKCVSVSCMVPDAVFNPYRTGQENGIAIFKTAKGAVIRIFIGFGVYVGIQHNTALYGTEGSIWTDKNKHFTEGNSFAKLKSVPGTIFKPLEIPVGTKFPGDTERDAHDGVDTKMIRDFVNCIINDTKPRVDIDLAINMALPGMIAAESARRGGELMEIPEID